MKIFQELANHQFGVYRNFLITLIFRPIPELYKDPGYVRSSRMRLSTSQVKQTAAIRIFLPLLKDILINKLSRYL